MILGSSSGFGQEAALELAKNGYNIYGVHFDLGSARQKVAEQKKELEDLGVNVRFFNVNAADDNKRKGCAGRPLRPPRI